MAERDVTVGQLLLAEYQTIKDEQKTRIGFRDNLLYVTLTVVAAVIAAAAQAERTEMLLALPPVCVVLGWTYLVNDQKISAIGAYVRGELGPRLATAAGRDGADVFRWEAAHRSDARRVSRKAAQCAVDLLAFCVVPLSALVVYWAAGDTSTGLVLLSALEALSVLALAAYIVQYALPFRPVSAPVSAPVTGTGNGPVTGTGNGPAAGTGSGPVTGTASGPEAGTGSGPVAGTGSGPAVP